MKNSRASKIHANLQKIQGLLKDPTIDFKDLFCENSRTFQGLLKDPTVDFKRLYY